VDLVLSGHYHGYAETTVNGVQYITSGAFTEGLMDSGLRHFLMVRVYGPSVRVDKIVVGLGGPIQYRDDEI